MKIVLQILAVLFFAMCPACLLLGYSVFHDFLGVAFAFLGIAAIGVAAFMPGPRKVIIRRREALVPKQQRDAIAQALHELS